MDAHLRLTIKTLHNTAHTAEWLALCAYIRGDDDFARREVEAADAIRRRAASLERRAARIAALRASHAAIVPESR
jgi:hypothetical protein